MTRYLLSVHTPTDDRPATMSEDEMRNFPAELGKMGFVFNFMTYGGHQIDGLAAEEFTTALREDGMLALARFDAPEEEQEHRQQQEGTQRQWVITVHLARLGRTAGTSPRSPNCCIASSRSTASFST